MVGHRDALLGEVRADGVTLLEIGHQHVDPVQLFPGPLDARIDPVGRGLGRRGGVHDLPEPGGAAGGVLGQQGMQEGGAASGEPGDEDRSHDFFLPDGGKLVAIAPHEQAVTQHPHHLGLHGDAPDQVEPGVLLEGAQQDSQGSAEGGVSEIVEPGRLAAFLQQGVQVERHQGAAVVEREAAQSIYSPDDPGADGGQGARETRDLPSPPGRPGRYALLFHDHLRRAVDNSVLFHAGLLKGGARG